MDLLADMLEPTSKKEQSVTTANDTLLLEVDVEEPVEGTQPQSFKCYLHTHLMNERNKSSQPMGEFIRYRQIIEHAQLLRVEGSLKHTYMLTVLKKVWMMRIFKDFIRDFEKEYFKLNVDIKLLKPKTADRYLFELFQLKEFIKSGIARLQGQEEASEVRLSEVLILSDEALYEALMKITKQFGQDTLDPNPQFKKISDMRKYKYDLLAGFQPLCLKYEPLANRDYIYRDLMYLLDEAMRLKSDYEHDMRLLCGPNIDCNIKVPKKPDGSFSVIGMRRMLAKWVENLIESDKELVESSAFHNFVRAKSGVFDNFYVNSTDKVPPIHQKINEILLELLINSVYEADQRNKEFGLYIYDLLRSKIVVESVEDIQKIIAAFENCTETKQKVELFRVKNRLPTHNRDVMINFRYGPVLAAELQIGLGHLGTYEQIKEKKKKYEYKHFLYQLSRSIFGPTMEMIIVYEDSTRKDIVANAFSVGKVTKRTDPIRGVNFTDLNCPSKHRMLLIEAEGIVPASLEMCRFCFQSLNKKGFLYCYQCTLTYCGSCYEEFKKNHAIIYESDKDPVSEICQLNEIDELKGNTLIVYHLKYSPASRMLMSCLSYMGKQLRNNPIKLVKVDLAKRPHFRSKLREMGIEKFPATVFYVDNHPSKIVIGCSIYKFFELINLMKEAVKTCPLGHQLFELEPQTYVHWQCNQCNKEREKHSKEKIIYCKECLYTCCSRCGFAASDSVGTYVDPKGASYLSTPWAIQQEKVRMCITQLCLNRHKMKLVHDNPSNDLEHKCFMCRNTFTFIAEYGMYICQQCGDKICDMCANAGFAGLIDQDEYANHFVDQYRLDLPLCTHCSHPYSTTRGGAVAAVFRCKLCKISIPSSIEHITCELCHVNMCSSCAQKLKVTAAHFSVKSSYCVCKSRLNPVPKNINELQPFECMNCHVSYYYNTPHFECSDPKHHFVMCTACTIKGKAKVKLYRLRQESNDKSDIKEFFLTLPLEINLLQLKMLMKKWEIIPPNCMGEFKAKKSWFSGVLPDTTEIQSLGSAPELYYFQQSNIIVDLVMQTSKLADEFKSDRIVGESPHLKKLGSIGERPAKDYVPKLAQAEEDDAASVELVEERKVQKPKPKDEKPVQKQPLKVQKQIESKQHQVTPIKPQEKIPRKPAGKQLPPINALPIVEQPGIAQKSSDAIILGRPNFGESSRTDLLSQRLHQQKLVAVMPQPSSPDKSATKRCCEGCTCCPRCSIF